MGRNSSEESYFSFGKQRLARSVWYKRERRAIFQTKMFQGSPIMQLTTVYNRSSSIEADDIIKYYCFRLLIFL